MRVAGFLIFILGSFFLVQCGSGVLDELDIGNLLNTEAEGVGSDELAITNNANFSDCLEENITKTYPNVHTLVDENVPVFYTCQEETTEGEVTDTEKRALAGDLVAWAQTSLVADGKLSLVDTEETKSVLNSLLGKLKLYLEPLDKEDVRVMAEKSLAMVNEKKIKPFPEEILEGMYEGVIATAPKGKGTTLAADIAAHYMDEGGSALTAYSNKEKETFYTSTMRKVAELFAGIIAKQELKDSHAENLFVKVLGSLIVGEKKKDGIVDVIAEILLGKDDSKKKTLKASAAVIVEEAKKDESEEEDTEEACSGGEKKVVRYKDSDEDGRYVASSSQICYSSTYPKVASDLTEDELANLDDDDTTDWDTDDDNVADNLDVCSGTDDALMAYRYKDSDEDGLYEKSTTEVCPDDETYTVAASELTAGELVNLDDDASTHWDLDGDGVANDADECEDIDDALMAYRYKDGDSDGAYAKSPEEVCPDDETYTVAADDLTNDEKTNLDSDDSTPNDTDGDGVIDNVDECPGEDDADIATRYKDADDDGLMVASEEELCPDDATYTFAAGDLTVYQTTVEDGDDSSASSGSYNTITTTELVLGYDFDGDGTDGESETIYVINNMTAFENWRGAVSNGFMNSSHALVIKDLDIADCEGAWCSHANPSTLANWTGFTTLDGGGHTIDYGDQGSKNVANWGVLFHDKETGIIRNLTINVEIIDTSTVIGGLLGYVESTSELTISNVTITGSIQGNSGVGGVIGKVWFSGSGVLNLDNVVNKATVTSVSCSSSVGTGGLIGTVDRSDIAITDSGNEGSVSCSASTAYNVGGLIGYATGIDDPGITMASVYNSGDIEGDHYIGGIMGRMISTDYLVIDDCYNVGNVNVSGSTTIGASGIVGILEGANSEINQCYNAGTLSMDSGSDTDLVAITNVDSDTDTFSDNFLLTGSVPDDADGDGVSAGVLSAANMKKQASFTNFNFGTCSDGAYTTEATCEAAEETWTQVWRISEDSTYPYLYGITPTTLPGSE